MSGNRAPSTTTRAVRFFRKSPRQWFQSFAFRWIRWFPGIPLPIRLPFGGWWLAEGDFLSASLLWEGFENSETAFALKFIQPGMTILDIGAHRGFYSLLFSRKTGASGRVLSFEPSPRERKKLLRHLRLNGCQNVSVFDCALGAENGTAQLFLVNGSDDGCNSLRPPDTTSPISPVQTRVSRLDEVLTAAGVERVDFLKIDVEGGELDVFRGASRLLEVRPRPVVLCEVLDQRTRPWNYPAVKIIEELQDRGYVWFELLPDAALRSLNPRQTEFDGNFVAVPTEDLPRVAEFIAKNPPSSDALAARPA